MRKLPIVVLMALSASFLVAVPAAAADAAHIRINQVGYSATGPKRAYLMASASQAGAPFTVKTSSGTTVLTGTVGASLGSWSSAFPAVHPIDFDTVTTAGTYVISTTGSVPATSLPVTVGSGAAVYATALSNARKYYEVQRDGPNYIPSALRTAAGHLNDLNGKAYVTPNVNSSGRFSGDLTPTGVTLDASGGWADAGDYLKFLHGASYTVDLLAVGVRDFPAAMGSFTNEVRHGNDWLLKMWDDANGVLYYQVGIGSGNAKTYGDHDVWRLPQADDTYGGTDPRYRYLRNRPVFRSNSPGTLISPNLAGRMAAAFALCYQIWRVSDPAYANSCLLKGQHIFDLANTNPSGNLVTVIPFSFYPETEWRDDLELGAAELARALQAGPPPAGLPHNDPAFYLQKAAHWANAYIGVTTKDSLNLYDVSGLAHYELHRAITTAGSEVGLPVTRAALVADLKAALDRAVAQGGTEPFGFGFPWNTWDTTSHGAGLSVMAAEYGALTGNNSYSVYANRWLGNILGANAWGSSFIIGTGQVWPHCPHHQLANLAGTLDGTAPQLVGAAVEGPNSITGRGSVTGTRACPPGGANRFGAFDGHGSKFLDNVESYPNIEPAIDLTAASPLAFAWQTVTPVATSNLMTTAAGTVVSLQFDDGSADQFQVNEVLAAHGLRATFYVNSGTIGTPGSLSWEQLATLAANGNEITGHTVDHLNLKKLKPDALRHQVCDDRAALTSRGYAAVSFAYPFGAFDAAAKQIVAECGYTTGRGVSGVDGRRTFAETLPPVDAFATRTPANVKSGTTLATMQSYVTAAETNGGGWVQIVFHRVCDRCDAYSVTLADFTALVQWLAARGTVVRTTAEAMAG